MFDWIKRAWRGWFGPSETFAEYAARTVARPVQEGETYHRTMHINAVLQAAQEATIAQKNVRLASIARTRDALKNIIADKKRAKKRTSHLQAELARLTRVELELESGK